MDIGNRLNKSTSNALRTDANDFSGSDGFTEPEKKVGDIIGEGLDIHHSYRNHAEREEKIHNILEKVGLAPEHADRYPHQFSGGQRQSRDCESTDHESETDYCG